MGNADCLLAGHATRREAKQDRGRRPRRRDQGADQVHLQFRYDCGGDEKVYIFKATRPGLNAINILSTYHAEEGGAGGCRGAIIGS